jgi:hypothetical protein
LIQIPYLKCPASGIKKPHLATFSAKNKCSLLFLT